MKVAYDVSPLLRAETGVGRYARELGASLERHGIQLVRYAVAFGGSAEPGVRQWRVPARVIQQAWKMAGRPRLEALVGDVDVVHATNFVLPALRDTPGVVTVHDLSFLRDDVFPGGQRLRSFVPWSLSRAARVLVPTHAIAEEVAARFGVSHDAIDVTHEGVAPLFFGATPLSDGALEELRIPGPFILTLGTIEPRKNLARLFAAWDSARSALPGWSLVVAGPQGWGPSLPETPGVIRTGWVAKETLPGLLAAADVFCYPSLYEGFGLPPLEAMATGTAVIAGRYSAADEVLGDAALLVDPTDVVALREALVEVASNDSVRRDLGFRGRARALRFTWEATARATAEAYARAAS